MAAIGSVFAEAFGCSGRRACRLCRGRRNERQRGYLVNVVQTHANILVADGTSAGKTTLTNALLAVAADSNDRIILIGDTRELRCDATNVVVLRTASGVTMAESPTPFETVPDRLATGLRSGS